MHTKIDTSLIRLVEEAKRFPMLTPEREHELALAWRDHGDRAALQDLVGSHLRLVVKIARGFAGYGLPLADLVAEGNVGLMQAAEKFDPDRGFRFATYAMWWIRAAIQEYVLHSWSLVKMGTTAAQKKLFFNLRKLKGRMEELEQGDLPRRDGARDRDRARRPGVRGGRDEPPPRRRRHLVERAGRQRRRQRMARDAARRAAEPGDPARRPRGVPAAQGAAWRRAQDRSTSASATSSSSAASRTIPRRSRSCRTATRCRASASARSRCARSRSCAMPCCIRAPADTRGHDLYVAA